MAGLVVVDTDLVIDYLRGRGPGAEVVRDLLVRRTLRLTAVTAFELRLGTDFLDRHGEIMRLFRSRTLPVDLAGAIRGGEVFGLLRSQGREIGMADSIQAGICLRHALPLATRNRAHFSRVEGLELASF